jgi:hypothetical protein
MDAVRTERIETAIDTGAAAIFASASAFSLAQLAGSAAGTAAGALLAFAGILFGLRSVAPEERVLPLPEFELQPALEVMDELILTDSDRWEPAAVELMLDDVLAQLGPNSRVVRLFDPASMPTPSELKARIDRHLDGQARSSPPDASQALHDALAELRRSLN